MRRVAQPDECGHVLVHEQFAACVALDVGRHHADAVGVVAGEVRFDQLVGDEGGFEVLGAHRLEDGDHVGVQIGGGVLGHGSGFRE